MTCDYCFYCDEANKRELASYGMMTEETLKNIMRRTILYTENLAMFTWQGGEPTMRGLEFFKTAVRLQRKYSRGRVRVANAFQTNGFMLTQEWCEFFKENDFLVGLSVDGTKPVHDAFRHSKKGETSFERVLRSAELMDNIGVEYNILSVVTPMFAQNIGEIYQFYKERKWKYQQYIACLEPYGEERGECLSALTPRQYGEFLTELFSLWYADLRRGTQPYIRQFENYVGMAAGFEPEACEMRGSCGVSYVVEADGSVYPCDFYAMDEFRLGNFNTNMLSEIDEKRNKIGFISRSQRLSEKCMQCNYLKLCRGGCMRNREQTAEGFHNYFCEGYKIFFENWYNVIMQLGSRIN